MLKDEDTAKVLIFPPVALLIAFGMAGVLQWLMPFELLPPPGVLWSTVLGLMLIGLALAVSAWGAMTMSRAGTPIDVRKPALRFVETGPYSFTRNPMYLGMLLLVIGVGFLLSAEWAFLGALWLWAVLTHGVIKREEAYLRARFGAPYEAYLVRTKRWV